MGSKSPRRDRSAVNLVTSSPLSLSWMSNLTIIVLLVVFSTLPSHASGSIRTLEDGTNSSSNAVINNHDHACTLRCENGGYCEFVHTNTSLYAREVQAGQLIQKCVCQPGFAGLACDVYVPECTLFTATDNNQKTQRKCFNGAPCVRKDNGDWGCDCTVADKISRFAGHMCRKPYTEYCSGGYQPLQNPESEAGLNSNVLTFCTNGSKCKSAFLAAQIAPGNLTVNLAYQHLGCVCNEAFYGPHCEFLRVDGHLQHEIELEQQAMVELSHLSAAAAANTTNKALSTKEGTSRQEDPMLSINTFGINEIMLNRNDNPNSSNSITGDGASSKRIETYVLVVFFLCLGLMMLIGMVLLQQFQRRRRDLSNAANLNLHDNDDCEEFADLRPHNYNYHNNNNNNVVNREMDNERPFTYSLSQMIDNRQQYHVVSDENNNNDIRSNAIYRDYNYNFGSNDDQQYTDHFVGHVYDENPISPCGSGEDIDDEKTAQVSNLVLA